MINYSDISSAYLLVSDLAVVAFSATGEMSLVVTDAAGDRLLSCRYMAVDGVVRVFDLDRLLEPLIAGVVADFTFTVGSESRTFHVVRSRVRVSEAADAFLTGHFLSSVMSERDTAPDRKEMVTLLSPAASVDVVAECVYCDDGGMCVLGSVTLASALAAGVVHEVDCSPSLLVDEAKGRLVRYTVRAGERSMAYRVSPTATHDTALLMRNDFGAWEPCYFTGMVETAPAITREFVQIGGVQCPLRIDEQETFKSYTGPLRPGSVQLMRSLARSTEVVLLDEGAVTGDGVVIIEQDIKYTDEDGHLPAFNFTWRRASRLPLLAVPTIPRLFDDTFDETYN